MTAASNEVALLPCPFCGGLAGLDGEPMRGQTLWRAGCDNVACPVEAGICSNDREKAITGWNTRAHSDPRPVAEGLREAGWVYEYDSGAGWERHVVLNTVPDLPTKRAPTKHYGSPDIRNVQPFYFATHSPAPMAGEPLREAMRTATGIASGPDGTGQMKVAVYGLEPGEEHKLHYLLSAAHPSTQEG